MATRGETLETLPARVLALGQGGAPNRQVAAAVPSTPAPQSECTNMRSLALDAIRALDRAVPVTVQAYLEEDSGGIIAGVRFADVRPFTAGLTHSLTLQPRKCCKCDEVRQPEEFPMDPRDAQKRLQDCTYCAQQDTAGQAPAGGPPGMSPSLGVDLSANPIHVAVAATEGGGRGGRAGEGFWHEDPAR